ncbi:MAG: tetratricopeptide repeat protein [Spirochaetaceae bacterium]|jgi:Flp pilus assembly protein TadD|nr:tetratricopeptide repeat protein [Spirochaetaceae bacterium]
MENTESRVIFLSVPESLRGRMESLNHHGHHHEDGYDEEGEEQGEGDEGEPDREAFAIDPAIPIPVELGPGEGAADLEQLSWEMILSGMLRVITSYELQRGALGAGLDAGDIAYYRRFVLAVRPGIREEFTGAAIVHARNHSFETALEILAVLRGLFPQAPEPLLNEALVLESRADSLDKAGREAEAEAEYGKVHETYLKLFEGGLFPEGLFNAGFFHMKRRNFAKAREYLSAYMTLAEDGEERDRAEAIVREIAVQSLDDETFREAYDAIRLGQEEEGLLKVRDFLERHSAAWNGWFLLGWGLRRLGRWNDGEAAFRKAVELGGGTSDTLNELAICLMEQGDHAAARRELEKALREEPENVKIISNLGVLALKTGRSSEAAGFFRTVLEIEPGDIVARRYLEGLGGSGI